MENRRIDKEVPVAIRTGIGEILKEAHQHMREKRLAHDGFQELQEVYARRIAKEKEEAVRNAKELADVIASVRVYCEKKATAEVEDREALSRKTYRKNVPKKKRRARRRRDRLMRYAVILAAIGILEQIIVYSSKTGGASDGLLAMALLFYFVSICLVLYAHYYVGPRSIGPWRPTDPTVLHDNVHLRAGDLLAKWENDQKQKREEMKQQKRDKRLERRLAHEAEIKADAEKRKADKIRADNARRRFAKPPCDTSDHGQRLGL